MLYDVMEYILVTDRLQLHGLINRHNHVEYPWVI